MILFTDMLKDFKPQHRIEQVMLITEFSCGCQSTITYAGVSTPHIPPKYLFALGKDLWQCNASCTENHEIDFSEFERLAPGRRKVDVVTEIKAFNTMTVSLDKTRTKQ